ncbi:hypothetical protein ABE430_20240 [Brevibacillus agri]|uniref:hypothetical protein n=1 Tax=Brevibacillus agri TaxID=51101 RepID=UPI003D1CFD96
MSKKQAVEKVTVEIPETVNLDTERESAADEKSKKEQLIYIGPNLPGGFLAQHTVFRDGIPKHLDGIRKTYPQVDTLIVPIAQLLEAQGELRRKGTAVQQAYQALSRKE